MFVPTIKCVISVAGRPHLAMAFFEAEAASSGAAVATRASRVSSDGEVLLMISGWVMSTSSVW